ncbi:MAG: ImmA/IrrE family metallo-endopeptidase [Parvibaculaceae bacterium]
MADKYQITFAALLMPDVLPPTSKIKVQDFRTHGGQGVKWGPELLAILDQINLDLEALAELRDYRPDLFSAPVLPEAALTDNPAVLASNERKRVGLDTDMQLGWATPSEAFKRLRALVEAQGILVHIVRADTEEHWRGLTIYDERQIPLIVINGDEREPERRIYSLFHEYAHVLLRVSAISGGRSTSTTEKFCNQFAAHFLMPEDAFKREAISVHGHALNKWENSEIKQIATRFKVTSTAVALHLENLHLTSQALFARTRGLWKGTPKKKGGKPTPYTERIANRLGDRHVGIVLKAKAEGLIDSVDAHELLVVSPSDFAQLEKKLKERQAAYGWRR